MASPNDLRQPLPDARIPNFNSTSTVKAPGALEVQGGAKAGVVGILGELLPQIVEGSDLVLKKDISQSLNDAVDQVNAEYGVDGRLFGQDVTDPNQLNNEEIQRASETISDIHEGYKSGRVADSHYWARLDSIARQLRTRYPGHREFIDQKIASIVGSTPSNRLREELAAEAKAKANNGAERDPFVQGNNAIIKEYVSNGLIDQVIPGWQDKVAGGQWDTWEVGRLLRAHKGRFSAIDNAKTELSFLEAQGQFDQKKAYETLNLELANNYMTATTAAFKPALDAQISLAKQVDGYLTLNRPINESEQLQLKQALAQYRIQTMKGFDALMVRDNGGWSYSTKLTVEQKRAAREELDQRIQLFEDVAAKPTLGMLHQLKDYMDNFQTSDSLALLQNDPAVRELSAMKMLPQSVQDTYLVTSGVYNEFTTNSLKGVYTDILRNKYDNFAASLAARTATVRNDPNTTDKEKNLQLKQVAEATSKSAMEIITSDQTPPDVLDKTIRGMFGADNNNYLRMFTDPDMKRGFYYQMVNPEVAKRMYELRTTNPEYWDLYKNWTENSFISLFKQHANEIKSAYANRAYVDMSFDGKHFDLTVRDTAKTTSSVPVDMWRKAVGLGGLEAAAEAKFTANASTAVRSMNTAIDGLSAVYSAEGSGDIRKKIVKVLTEDLGIDPNAKFEGSNTDQAFIGLGNLFLNAVEGIGAKTKKKIKKIESFLPDGGVPPDQNKTYQLVE